MGAQKQKTEGGQGGRRGRSKMDHWVTTAEIKDAARIRRRRESKTIVAKEKAEADKAILFTWEVLPGKWTVKKKFVGQWRITELKDFDTDYADLCGPANVEIDTRGTGSMNFGAVEMELDCKMDDQNERVLCFTFEGADEGDPISGRGYCLVDNDDMIGRMYRHFGDKFDFKARRMTKDKKA